MSFDGAQCNNYIGRGAGKKLLQKIWGAQNSIKIVPLYPSPSLMKELIALIDVQLMTPVAKNDLECCKLIQNNGLPEKDVH